MGDKAHNPKGSVLGFSNLTEKDNLIIQHLEMLTEATSKQATEEIIRLFLKDTPVKISTLTQALEEANFALIEQLSHQLKSSSGYLGLTDLQEIFERLEQTAIKKEGNELEKFKETLSSYYPKLNDFLRSYISPNRKREESYASRPSH